MKSIAELQKKVQEAWTNFAIVDVPATKKYEKARLLAWEAYSKARRQAGISYEESTIKARKALNKALERRDRAEERLKNLKSKQQGNIMKCIECKENEACLCKDCAESLAAETVQETAEGLLDY